MSALSTTAGNAPAREEATVQDLKLAEALGYARATDIRKLIIRHATTLELFGSLRHRGVMIEAGKGARRSVTEYHLTKAQAAFITAKADTKNATSLTVLMAEVFAMASDGKLVAVDAAAAEELVAAQARDARRRHEEERDARSSGFAALR
ncbi:hypothetical protein [Methylobacterium sp. WL9]|uniref:hypothetical protein n=1 Tax=Methylobacterium sp. WL9 TaxID=2603898 RepID=UPI00164F82BD|nr:hypothetical protein [Methylobacterium sp. WL9]